jgi:GINS complex subunit 1
VRVDFPNTIAMYCELAQKLVCIKTHEVHDNELRVGHDADNPLKIQHAKRTQSLAHLPPYPTEVVRAVVREIRDLDKDTARILAPFGGSFNPHSEPATACALLIDHLCMRRNKRCLLAYHRVRTEKLEEMCWKGIDLLDQTGNNENEDGASIKNQSSLSPEEEEYFRQYNDMLAAYRGQWTDIDLTGSLEPPKDLFIDVRVLKDAGEIQTEYGYVAFQPLFYPLP